MAKRAKKPVNLTKVEEKTENTDYDNPWKSFIEAYFRDFLLSPQLRHILTGQLGAIY
jgi:hypothetical protein